MFVVSWSQSSVWRHKIVARVDGEFGSDTVRHIGKRWKIWSGRTL
jgi:hypothetical protein